MTRKNYREPTREKYLENDISFDVESRVEHEWIGDGEQTVDTQKGHDPKHKRVRSWSGGVGEKDRLID